MDEALYHRHFAVEDSHWWFQGRAAVVLSLLDRFCPVGAGEAYLDVGCGTGLILKALMERGRAIGVDMSPLAVDYARKRGIQEVYCQPLREVALQGIRVAVLLDVIEHVEDDLELLRQVHDILLPGGQVLITVPAYPWLWSQHDVLNHHYRRYTRPQLAQVLTQSGFKIEKLTFYNTWLFLPALVQKLLSGTKTITDAAETIPTVPPLLNTLFREIFASERWFLPYLDFPFGVSLLALGRKAAPVSTP